MTYTRTNEFIDPDKTGSWFVYTKGEVWFDFDIKEVHTLIITYYNKKAKIIALNDSGNIVKVKTKGDCWDEGCFTLDQAFEVIIFNHKEMRSENWKKVDSFWNK